MDDPTAFLNTYIIPYLKVSKSCAIGAYTDCFGQSKAIDNVPYLITDVNDVSSFMHGKAYVLNDGTAVDFYSYGNAGQDGSYAKISSAIAVVVDLNGSNNPNTVGKDIFAFNIIQSAANHYNAAF